MAKYIMPLLVLFIIVYSYIKKNDIFNDFIEGSKESIDIIINMFPTLLAMILGINLVFKSGIIDILSNTKISVEIITLMFTRPISGSSSLLVLNNIYKLYGPDSFMGILASVMQGSTDTTFYIITLYYSIIKIKKIRYSLIVCLLTDLSAFIISYIVVKCLL